ncbi:transcriptional regulator [Virgibacillus phasianinus]|uniref:Transcriptional regulator n=1 Tax=Virgibacillus phasianinus TaxID=2017483 RepID=A0A220U6Z0_9BACI|nr:helix-turn-helix transcriptional regulator [Virgibacillus phasianinus]ASK63918.1 transcriptional regulator [Virgibacillus phasianinus]
MDIGKIIKFYREKSGMTQVQLGKGICSVTHISKIELGQTHCSNEIITLLAKRLNINIETEIKTIKATNLRLEQWLEALIMQWDQEIETIKQELERSDHIAISGRLTFYKLLKARYYLLHEENDRAGDILSDIRSQDTLLSPFEDNFKKHVLGILHLRNQEYVKAIDSLKSIHNDEYNNSEYYYHLAVAYDNNNGKHMAYSYAVKALKYFKKTNNFLKVIDSEMLLLILQSQETLHDFHDRLKKYNALIQTCELCNNTPRKATVLHNMAYEYFTRSDYKTAGGLYKQSMVLKEKESDKYLLSLEGYIQSCARGKLVSDEELLKDAMAGLHSAKRMNASLFIHLFNLTVLLINSDEETYVSYLKDHALPFFKLTGHIFLINRSQKELFYYYSKTEQLDQAVKVAHTVLEH